MIFEVKLKNENSCCDCPLMGVAIWNEKWTCKAGFGSIPHKVEELYRPRPEACKAYFKKKKTLKYKEE